MRPSMISREKTLQILEKAPWLFLSLSLGGWLIFVIAFGLTNHSSQLLDWLGNRLNGRTQNLFSSFWLCCFVGAVLYISAYLHLFLRRWYTSVILHVLTAVYLVSCGATLMTEVILNRLTLDYLSQTQPLWSYVQMEMAGIVISLVTLSIFMCLWPLLSVRTLPPSFLSLDTTSHCPCLPRSALQPGDTVEPLIQDIPEIRTPLNTYQPAAGKGDTGHQFTVTNTAAVEGEGASTEHEKAGLLQDKN